MERLPDPSQESFTRLFKSETDLFSSNKTDVYYFFDLKIEEAFKEGRIGTAHYYQECRANLKKYKSSLYFEDLGESFLKQYPLYLQNRGNAPSTIALRLRCLKIMCNYAINKGFIAPKHYPFRKFHFGSSARSKKVLYPQQLKVLFDYVPKTFREDRAKDYFFFCFLCNGMNFKDMAYLKRSQINQNTLTYVRQKTKNTTHDTQAIQVYLHDEVKRIISKWGNKDISPDAYLFPILPSKPVSLENTEAGRSMEKRKVNKYLKLIGRTLEFDFNITISLARHSFATTLKLNGTHVSFISELLGHTSMKTTMHYLKTIPGEELKAISDSLLKFG